MGTVGATPGVELPGVPNPPWALRVYVVTRPEPRPVPNGAAVLQTGRVRPLILPRSTGGRVLLGAVVVLVFIAAAGLVVRLVAGSSNTPSSQRTATAVGSSPATGPPSAATSAPTASPTPSFSTGYDWDGIAALPHCSASLIRFATSRPADPGLLLTNGHCTEYGFLRAQHIYRDRPSHLPVTLYGPTLTSGGGKLTTTRLLYATMTGTDVAIYRLDRSYAQIIAAFGVHALVVASATPAAGTPVTVPSGFWKTIYRCAIDRHVYQLREGAWIWNDALKYTTACHVIHGTSGAPILDDARRVVGINNTNNDNGARCTENNPCEVSANRKVSYAQGWSYGQETSGLTSCIGPGNTIDLTRPSCRLTR